MRGLTAQYHWEVVYWVGLPMVQAQQTDVLPSLSPWSEVKVAQSCLTLWDPMDYTVHGILQARILEWVAFPFSRWSSQPRDQIQVSSIVGGFFTSWATRGAQEYWSGYPILSPVDLPNPGIELGSPALQADSLPTELSRKPRVSWWSFVIPSSYLSLAFPSLSNHWFPFCHYRFICIFL